MALKPFLPATAGDFSALGKKIFVDSAMNTGTSLALDFLDPAVWPTQGNAATGATFASLVPGGAGAESTGTYTLVWNTDGFDFNGNDNQTITLPDAAKLVGSTRFAVSFVIEVESQAQATKSRVLGYFDGSDSTGPWGMYTQNNYFYPVINGQTVGAFNTATYGAGTHTFTLAWDGSYCYLYVDGVLRNTVVATSATLVPPTDTTTPSIGEISDDETSFYWTGRACRLLIHDLTSSDLTIAEVAAAEWSVSDGRFA